MITAGIKAADYKMSLNQYQDNGKTVGCLGGVAIHLSSRRPESLRARPSCIGGAAFVSHSINYNNWLPTLTAQLPPAARLVGVRSVRRRQRHSAERRVRHAGRRGFDAPEADLAKTYQTGSVLKFKRFTLDVDAYYVHFQNGFDSYLDPVTAESVFVATGPSNTKGIESGKQCCAGLWL